MMNANFFSKSMRQLGLPFGFALALCAVYQGSFAMAADKMQITSLSGINEKTHCEFFSDEGGEPLFVILQAPVGEDNIEADGVMSIDGVMTELSFERRRIFPSIHRSGWGLDMRVYRSKTDPELAVTALIQPTNPNADEMIGTLQVVSPDFGEKVHWTGACR